MDGLRCLVLTQPMLRYVTRKVRKHKLGKLANSPSAVLLRAVIESALVSWVGLLLDEVTSLAPQGRITVGSEYIFPTKVLKGIGHFPDAFRRWV